MGKSVACRVFLNNQYPIVLDFATFSEEIAEGT
jgi:hypothetical protein